jgi:hypothetical protein
MTRLMTSATADGNDDDEHDGDGGESDAGGGGGGGGGRTHFGCCCDHDNHDGADDDDDADDNDDDDQRLREQTRLVLYLCLATEHDALDEAVARRAGHGCSRCSGGSGSGKGAPSCLRMHAGHNVLALLHCIVSLVEQGVHRYYR